jgi:hypothetical protein
MQQPLPVAQSWGRCIPTAPLPTLLGPTRSTLSPSSRLLRTARRPVAPPPRQSARTDSRPAPLLPRRTSCGRIDSRPAAPPAWAAARHMTPPARSGRAERSSLAAAGGAEAGKGRRRHGAEAVLPVVDLETGRRWHPAQPRSSLSWQRPRFGAGAPHLHGWREVHGGIHDQRCKTEK